MDIVIVTDAWFPQVNGVVRTLDTLASQLRSRERSVLFIEPSQFKSIPCPSYPEIRLSVLPRRKLEECIGNNRPRAIHIATEGPLGMAARAMCKKRGWPFTTSFHTRFPEYVRARYRIPLQKTYPLLRNFHSAAARTMVATPSVALDLRSRGFRNLVRWSRGVDIDLFKPRPYGYLPYDRPIQLYAGRVAIEKNIEAFLSLQTIGTKVVVGDGPALPYLRKKFPDVVFVGAKFGEELAKFYSDADVFIFPSKTDTFGLVIIEALASGTPVAAYPVPGPLDTIGNSGAGVLNDDLSIALERSLTIDPQLCRSRAKLFSWRASADQFLKNLANIY